MEIGTNWQTHVSCFNPEERIGLKMISRLVFHSEDCHPAAVRLQSNFAGRCERHSFLMKGSTEANQHRA